MPISQHRLDTARHENLGHRLIAIADDFSGRVLQEYTHKGYADIRPAHGAVLRNLGLQGARLTTLSARADVTHRAMTKLVEDTIALGLVRRLPDPDDGRASLLAYTPRGLHLLRDSSGIIERIYLDYSQLMGASELKRLEERLYTVIARLGIEVARTGQQALHPPEPGARYSASGGYMSHNLGRYLQLLGTDYHRSCACFMEAAGYPGIRIDHLAVVSHLSLAGMTLTRLAESAGISAQATGKQVKSLQRLGYVDLEVDPQDRRARQIAFTSRGRDYISTLLDAFGAIEQDYRCRAGSRNLRQLQHSLALAISALKLKVPLRGLPRF